MLELVIAPSGLGKTYHIVEDIKIEKDKSKIIVVAPDQNSYNFEKILCETLGATFNIDVVNFTRLYKKINSIVGIDINATQETDKYFYYLELLERLKNKDNFLINRLKQDIDFIHVINDLIEELDEYGVTSEKLQEYTEKVGENIEKFKDLVVVYTEYKNILVENKEYSKLEYIEKLIQCLEHVDLTNYIFYIDGYYNFSPVEYKVIEKLIKKSKKVVISVISELDRYTNFKLEHLIKDELSKEKRYNFINLEMIRDNSKYSLDIYRKSHEIMAYINSMIFKNNISEFNIVSFYSEQKNINHKVVLTVKKNYIDVLSIEEYNQNRFDTVELYHLQKEFIKLSKSYKQIEKSSVVIYEAPNIETEIKQLSRNISSEIKKKNYKLSDIAILYRDDVYENYDYILKGFGINVHIDRNMNTSSHRLIKLMKNILNYKDENFKFDILNILKSDLVSIELDCENSEKIILNDIEKILDSKLINTLQDIEKVYFDVPFERYSKGKLRRIKEYLLNVAKLINKLKKKKKVEHFVKEILTILDLFGVEKKMFFPVEDNAGLSLEELEEKNINKQVFEKFIKILEDLNKHRGKKLSYEFFSKILVILMEKITYRSIPRSEEYVIMSKIDLAKVENKKIVFLLGLNKEVLPKTIKTDGIIDDKDKYNLSLFGIELSPRSKSLMTDEEFVAYIALTRAKEKLYISYSLVNSKYLPQKQSLYIDTIYKILRGNDKINLKRYVDKEVIFNLKEFKFYDVLKNRLKFYSQLEIIYYFNKIKYSRKLGGNSKKYEVYLTNIYEKIIEVMNGENKVFYDLQENIDYISETSNNYSFSKLRRYEQNSFIYFVENILKITPEKSRALSPLLIGAYKHAILEDNNLLKYINDKVEKFDTYDLEELDIYIEKLSGEIKKRIESIVKQAKHIAIRQFTNIVESQHINSYITDRILEDLVKTVEIEIKYQILSGYKIYRTEKNFTLECSSNRISLSLPNGKKVVRKLEKEYNIRKFKFKGVIDRIDENDGYYLIIDYKSSKMDFEVEHFYNKEISQLLTYLLAVSLLENVESEKLRGVFYRELAKKGKDSKEYRLRGIMNEKLLKEINKISEMIFVRIKKDSSPYANDQHKVYSSKELDKLIDINIEYLYILVKKIQSSQYNLTSLEAEYKSVFDYALGENIIIEKEYEKIQPKDFKKLIFE